METGVNGLIPLLDTAFDLPSRDWSQYSPLTLAYIGDSVYDVIIRTILVKRANRPSDVLNRLASRIVCATAQAKMIGAIRPLLDEEETAVYRRGRNSSPATKAKNASMHEYLEATGLEALLGYLYLCGRYERMVFLVREGLERTGADRAGL